MVKIHTNEKATLSHSTLPNSAHSAVTERSKVNLCNLPSGELPVYFNYESLYLMHLKYLRVVVSQSIVCVGRVSSRLKLKLRIEFWFGFCQCYKQMICLRECGGT